MLSLVAGVLASTFDFGAPMVSDVLSRQCAAALAESARSRGLSPGLTGPTVTFAEGSVTLRARIEARQRAQGRSVVGVAVEAAVGTQPGFTVGSVGVGRDETEAVDTAIDEWRALVTPALIGALVTRERGERYRIDGYIAYPGATGFRAANPPGWGSAEHERLLTTLRRALPLPVSGRLRALNLTVMVEPDQPPQGEVRFDGVVAPSLWPAVQVFDWPRARGGYIFKQFYILVPDE